MIKESKCLFYSVIEGWKKYPNIVIQEWDNLEQKKDSDPDSVDFEEVMESLNYYNIYNDVEHDTRIFRHKEEGDKLPLFFMTISVDGCFSDHIFTDSIAGLSHIIKELKPVIDMFNEGD